MFSTFKTALHIQARYLVRVDGVMRKPLAKASLHSDGCIKGISVIETLNMPI